MKTYLGAKYSFENWQLLQKTWGLAKFISKLK